MREFHGGISQQQTDETPGCHSIEFLPGLGCELVVTIQPAKTYKHALDINFSILDQDSIKVCIILAISMKIVFFFSL